MFRASRLLSALSQLGAGKDLALYLQLFPGAPDTPLTLGTNGFWCERGDGWGMGYL